MIIVEPKLGHFLTILKSKNFEVSDFLDGEDKNLDNIRELITYLDKNQAESTLEGIKKLGEHDQEIIIENLTLLYPLSQHLMFKILDGIEKSDHSFIKKFDIDKGLCNKMDAILKDVKNQIGKMTSTGNEYTDKINKLKKDIESLEAAYENQKEISDLEKTKNDLEEELKQENINSKIAALKKENSDCEAKIKKIKDDTKKLKEQKGKLVNELRDLERKLDDTRQIKLLKQFLVICPKDEVDE